jgi:hypothetical protein
MLSDICAYSSMPFCVVNPSMPCDLGALEADVLLLLLLL